MWCLEAIIRMNQEAPRRITGQEAVRHGTASKPSTPSFHQEAVGESSVQDDRRIEAQHADLEALGFINTDP